MTTIALADSVHGVDLAHHVAPSHIPTKAVLLGARLGAAHLAGSGVRTAHLTHSGVSTAVLTPVALGHATVKLT